MEFIVEFIKIKTSTRFMLGGGYCKKKQGARIFGQNFWLVCFSAFKVTFCLIFAKEKKNIEISVN